MGDQPHIIELIDQLLSETADNPKLQEKIFDLRDALFQAQQVSQQYALKIKNLEETVAKLKSPAHRIGTVLGTGKGRPLSFSSWRYRVSGCCLSRNS